MGSLLVEDGSPACSPTGMADGCGSSLLDQAEDLVKHTFRSWTKRGLVIIKGYGSLYNFRPFQILAYFRELTDIAVTTLLPFGLCLQNKNDQRKLRVTDTKTLSLFSFAVIIFLLHSAA